MNLLYCFICLFIYYFNYVFYLLIDIIIIVNIFLIVNSFSCSRNIECIKVLLQCVILARHKPLLHNSDLICWKCHVGKGQHFPNILTLFIQFCSQLEYDNFGAEESAVIDARVCVMCAMSIKCESHLEGHSLFSCCLPVKEQVVQIHCVV